MTGLCNGYTDTIADIRKVYANTVLKRQGNYVYIMDIEVKTQIPGLVYTPLPYSPNHTNWEAVTSPQWDFSNIKLGYVNDMSSNISDESSFYLERKPVRIVRQGLHKDNIHIKNKSLSKGWPLGALVKEIGFNKCLLGDYPTYTVAVAKLLSGLTTTHAYHRQWGLRLKPHLGILFLEYRGEPVASSYDDGKTYIFTECTRYIIDEFLRKAKADVKIKLK